MATSRITDLSYSGLALPFFNYAAVDAGGLAAFAAMAGLP
jgi:hypothetical protein